MPVQLRKKTGRPPEPLPTSIDPNRRAFSSLLRSVRADRGLTQAALGVRLGISRGYIAQLERGEKPPQAEIARRLSDEFPAAFDAATKELAATQTDASTALRLWRLNTEEPTEVSRPAMLPELALIGIRQAMQLQTPDPTALADRVQDLLEVYPSTPVDEILGHLVFLQDLLLRSNLLNQVVSVSLAKVQGLLGKVSHDLGDASAALVHLHVAADAASRTEAPELQAWIHNLESLVHYWTGNAARAWTSACLADRATPPGSMAAWAAASKVRAAALIPDMPLVRQLTQRLETQEWDNSAHNADRGLLSFPEEKQLYYIAEAFALAATEAADVSAAVDRATEAVAAYESRSDSYSYSDWAGARAALSLALVKSGDIRRADGALERLLLLDRPRRIGGIRASLRNVYQAVQTRDTSGEELRVSTAMRNRIEDFVADGWEVASNPLTRVAQQLVQQSSLDEPAATRLGEFVDACITKEPSTRRHGLKLAERLDLETVDTVHKCYQQATTGNADAAYQLGRLLHHSNNPDLDEALWWYQKAAEAGHTEAVNSVESVLTKGLDAPELHSSRSPSRRIEGQRSTRPIASSQRRSPVMPVRG